MIRTSGTKTEFSRTRRDSTRVIFEILSLTMSGPSKTQIIFKINLSYQLAERYIGFLLNKALLKAEVAADGLTKYSLTAKGERLLHLLREVEIELNDLFVKTPLSATGIPDPVSPFYLKFDS